ncbi:MAG: hypothetical protein R6X02_22050 [Enhygromyxa sp.]
MRTPTVLLALTALALVPGCKKGQETQNPDQITTNSDGGTEPDEDVQANKLPPQDPDPAELGRLYDRYLAGDYEAVVAGAEELRAGLTADTQVRAHALAAAIEALAASENLPEDGQALAEQAVADGDRLGDPEVQQLAHVAHGVYLVRVHEAAAGQTELERALDLAGPYTALAHLMLGEAHLNQAFGVGESEDKIENPARLDDARAAYQAALDNGSDILKAHAHEGLAAIAKYKNDKQAICEHAQQAENLYVAAGATDYVREVPVLLANEGRCKDFKKAK